MRVTTDTLDVGGFTIGYDRAGRGPPLVLLHGGQADRREWRRQTERLADAFTVVAWDTPGCGLSSDAPDGFGLSGYAGVLAAFVRALGLGPAAICGLSFGSGLALQLQHDHPDTVSALVLVAPYAGWAGSLSRGEIDRRIAGLETGGDDGLPGLFSEHADPAMIAECEAITRDARPRAQRTMLHAFAVADLRPALPGVAVPTLIVHGDLDVRSPPHVSEAIQAAVPGARRVLVDGCGHMVNLEAPERLETEVRAFLGA